MTICITESAIVCNALDGIVIDTADLRIHISRPILLRVVADCILLGQLRLADIDIAVSEFSRAHTGVIK